MKPPSFDTFEAARALEAAGVERHQAEAIVSAIDRNGELATKSDLSVLEARMFRALWIQGGAIVAVIAGLKLLA